MTKNSNTKTKNTSGSKTSSKLNSTKAKKSNIKIVSDKKKDKKRTKKLQNTSSDDDFETKIEDIRQALKDNYAQQKNLMNDLRELLTLHKKEIKLVSKSGNRSNSGKNSGFNKPEPVPLPLKKLLKIKDDMLPRSKVTGLMYQYFTDNKMYNTKTKKEIIPNSKIKQIFGMSNDDVINFYNLQTWLKKVYSENSTDSSTLKIEE